MPAVICLAVAIFIGGALACLAAWAGARAMAWLLRELGF